MTSSENIRKGNYDIAKLEKQWLWYICAVLLLALMFAASFVCFRQGFVLMNENRDQNKNSQNILKR